MKSTALQTVPGSLQAQAQATNTGLAETFLNCDLIVIVDTSGSMGSSDAPGGQKRYDAACRELATLQANHPGKVGVIAFSTTVEFCPGGVPRYLGGGTALDAALDYCLIINGLCDLVVISDGQPNDATAALRVAKRFTESDISTVYVGPEGGPGADFLCRLAAASGGKAVTAANTAQLAQQVERLLLTAGSHAA